MSSKVFPEFENLNLHQFPRVHGFYILGLLQTLRPDVTWITPDLWYNYKDCSWLHQIIQNSLDNKKSVALVPWDEGLLAHPDSNLATIINQYQDQPVWLVSQLDTKDQIIYKNQFGITCSVVELPWSLLNDTVAYYHVCSRGAVNGLGQSQHNYLCMLGRFQSHKFDLALALREKNLHRHGLITVSDPDKYPESNREFCVANPHPPQDAVVSTSLPGLRSGARYFYKDIWISGNVKNYLHIENTYSDIPLIVHPDTTCGIFQNTEKVLWPLLLGKLMLMFGRPGIMASIQKWYDVDFAEYADLTFDSYSGDWSTRAHHHRLELLLDRNRNLICNASGVFKRLQQKIESARWTIGRNLYEYFVNNVDKIHAHT